MQTKQFSKVKGFSKNYRDRGSWRKTLRGGLLSDNAESIRPKRQCLLRLYDSLDDPTNS